MILKGIYDQYMAANPDGVQPESPFGPTPLPPAQQQPESRFGPTPLPAPQQSPTVEPQPPPELKPMETTLTNRWGYDPATMEHLKSQGYTEDSLNRIVGMYDPANYGSPNRQWYEANVPAPAAPDEKKIKTARMVAGLGDALALLAQSFAAERGAHVTARPYEASALAQATSREQQLRDRFQQEYQRYRQGLADAGLRDIARGQDQYNRDKAELQDVLETKQRLDRQQQEFEATEARRAAEADAAQANKDRDHEFRIGQQKATEAYRREQIGIARAREERLSKPGGGKNNTVSILLNANPNDPEAQTGSIGGRVRAFDLSPEEFAYQYGQAIRDEEFIKNHPEFSATQDILGGIANQPTGEKKMVAHNADMMRRIVATYLQEREYDPQWATSSVNSSPQYTLPWLGQNYRPSWGQNAAEDDEWGEFAE